MERQAHHIQLLLADELDQYKCKEYERVETYIKTIQDIYQELYYNIPQPITTNKKKQKEVFLYKPYNISLKDNTPSTLEPSLMQEEINNLKKALKTL